MQTRSVARQDASSVEPGSIHGIWRRGAEIHANSLASVSLAQPAEVVDNPRWDYVIKMAADASVEGRRQISEFAKASAGVKHAGLVPVLDASLSSAAPYLVMPRIEGETLQTHLDSDANRPLAVGIWLTRQIAEAISALHNAGWIHGDVKPGNAMVGDSGHVTVIDLGFAARIHSVPGHIYRGTPAYSAPEQLSGEMAMIPAMDVFSIGRILQQFLHRFEPPRTELVRHLDELARRMVNRNPINRPSAAEAGQQLLRFEIEALGSYIVPEQRRAA